MLVLQSIALFSEKQKFNFNCYEYLIEKRNHNPNIKLVVNTIQNLMANTTYKQKKKDAPDNLISILELIADLLASTNKVMNFLSDELLFEKSQKLANLKITRCAYRRSYVGVE